MKLRYFPILLQLVSLVIGFTVKADNNIYIYRNDGKFNAFHSEDVDSMRYSDIDLDGIRHSGPVVQEICTADSIYRIPLAVIDSVSVLEPEIRYTSKVKHLYPDYVPYILGTDSLTLSVDTTLPYDMTIKKGDILVYERFDELFENGFAGRVVSITNTGYLSVVCEAVELSEIYDQFIGFGETTLSQDEKSILCSQYPGYRDGGIHFDTSLTPVLETVACIRNGSTYIEATVGFRYETDIKLQIEGGLRGCRRGRAIHLPIAQPVPALLNVTMSFEPFVEGEISGAVSGGVHGYGSNTLTVIYDNGTWSGSINNSGGNMELDGELVFNGSISGGASLAIGICSLGGYIDARIGPSAGICLDFELARDFDSFDRNTFYDFAKESTITCSLFGEVDLRTRILSNTRVIPISSRVEAELFRWYLVPTFSDPVLEPEKESISVSTQASRPVLFPCRVGLAVLDENNKEVDSYFEDNTMSLRNNSMDLNHKFRQGLKSGNRYTIRPIVSLLGYEMFANPEEEVYLDCNITTAPALATTYSVHASGYFDEEVAGDVEVGFVYTDKACDPTVENASKSKGSLSENIFINGGFSGLAQGTTYYYRAYAHYNDKYYYGNTQCVTTKKNCDRSDAENTGGYSRQGVAPIANVGGSFDVEQREAKIELDFNEMSPSATCGYYLEGDDKDGKRVASQFKPLGTVTGRYTVELKGLVPGTTYRYWSEVKSSRGVSRSPIQTFETEQCPDPSGSIAEVSDIEMRSAKVTCKFDKIEKEYQCGLIISDGNFEYRETMEPDEDGMASLTIERLVAETRYALKTYIVTDTDKGTIIDENEEEFTTAAPDITGSWIFDTNGQAFAASGPFDLEILASGRTNNFFGVNYMTWVRNGRNIILKSGIKDSTTHWEFNGRFNEDFTYATGKVSFVNNAPWAGIDNEVLLSESRPFTLTRKQ